MARLRAWAVCVLLLLTACQSDEPLLESFPRRSPVSSPTSSETLVIGLVGTLTGPDGWRGEDAFEGADLAVHELNRGRSEEDPAFELVSLDDFDDPERAADLVEQLAGSERTVGIVYAGPVDGLEDAEPALAAADIPLLAVYGDLYAARSLSPHVFQLAPSYLWQARRIAGYLVRDRRYLRVGVLVSGSPEGELAAGSLRSAFREAGSRISMIQTYRDGVPEAELRALKRRAVEAIVVEADGPAFQQTLHGLREMSALYRSTDRARTASARTPKLRRRHSRRWRPQVVGLDQALGPGVDPDLLVPGTIAAETYARGAHYLPVPSLRAFAKAFRAWWEGEPLGWERRSYEAARILGWALARTDGDDDLAEVLESLRGRRFGGLGVTFGPDDHTSVDATTVGLWVVPRTGIPLRERDALPERLPWVPLSRGFSIDGQDTDIQSEDWRFLVRNAPNPDGPAPKLWRVLFGVATKRTDPVH